MKMESFSPNNFHNWLPSKLFEKERKLFIEWVYLWDVPFTMPFFDETLTKCKMANSIKGLEQMEKRITPIEFLTEVAQSTNSVDPGLFIFHTSRCGSTLTTQILSLDKKNIVYPEYIVFDAILRACIHGKQVSAEKRKEWLGNLIRVMGQKRSAEEERLIIKLDSWHLGYHSLIRELYPDVPFAVMYREPEAILQSNKKQWGMQFISEIIPPSIFNIEKETTLTFSLIEYANHVLQSMYSTIQKIAGSDKHIILLDYCNGVNENLNKLTEYLKIDQAFMKRQDVIKRLLYHSKRPTDNFTIENAQLDGFADEETIQIYNQLKFI